MASTLPAARRAALDGLVDELRGIFQNRLRSVCVYGLDKPEERDTHTIAFVDHLTFEDLAACAPRTRGWLNRGLAVPLILQGDEFARSLDVFPLEYGEIIAHHVVLFGPDPFGGAMVSEQDRRRGCELQAKSHLIHLRESFLETQGDPRAVVRMVGASAEGFRRLLENLVTLVRPAAQHAHGHPDLPEDAERLVGVPASLTRDVLATAGSGPSTIADPTALLARYIDAVEDIWGFVDKWKR
ncbi:MAG TPA: hypothetical protein VJ276_06345 [Thermoanaerobaculia bacterium]|nr:hypothetical protein [Thermoanaerobaculia bacterium]